VKPFSVRIVANDGVVLEKDAVALHLLGVGGHFTVLGDHAPLVSLLAAGPVRLETVDGQSETRPS
jgi:F-type H+-transporting ATPase subunit epsilon